jgi:hypothetical protein
LGKVGLTRSGTCPGTTQVSTLVKFRVTCSGTAQVATRVRHRVTRLGMTQVSDSSKVPCSESSKELGTVLDKGPSKNSGKVAGQDKEISLLWGQFELKKEI